MATPLTGRTVFFWFFAFFALIFAANIVMVWIAFSSWTGVETDSTYNYSQNYHEVLADARLQESLKWDIEIDTERNENGQAQLLVIGKDKNGIALSGYSVVAELKRPTRSVEDRQIKLAELKQGTYRGEAQNIAAGQWNLVIDFFENDVRVFRSKNRVYLQE